MKSVLTFAAALALAGCGGSDKPVTAPAGSVKSVAAPTGQDWTQVVSKTVEGGYVMGNPAAPLKLVEYGSRTCPTCGVFGQTGMRPLEASYVKSGKVSYEFRDFMVHAPDLGVAMLGHCAGAAPFFPILEQMYLEQPGFLEKLERATPFQQSIQGRPPQQQAVAWVEHLGYLDFLKQRGVAEPQARACLADSKLAKAVTDVSQRGIDDGVTGTPTFFLNGQKLDGQITWPDVEKSLKAAGA